MDKNGIVLLGQLASLKKKKKLDDVVCFDMERFEVHLKPNSVFFPQTHKEDVELVPTPVGAYYYSKNVHKGFMNYTCLANSRFLTSNELKYGMDMPKEVEELLVNVVHAVQDKTLKGVKWIGMSNSKNRMWVLYDGKEFENDASVFVKSKHDITEKEYIKVTRMKGFDLFRPVTAKEYANSLVNGR